MGNYREKANEYRRNYRKQHPEKELQWRINNAVKLLQLHGYEVAKKEEKEGQ